MAVWLICSLQTFCSAEYSTFWTYHSGQYPNYWQDNKNYPLVFARNGIAWYLDKNSIQIEVDDPPYYIIKANTILSPISSSAYSPNPELDKINSYRFFYDESTMDMRLDSKSDNWELFFSTESNINDWIYIYPPLNWGLSGCRPVCVGEAVFYVSQGRKFYGDFLWNPLFFDSGVEYVGTDYKPEYVDVFRDGFYKTLK